MFDELERLETEVREFQANADLDFVDPKRLSTVVNSLQGTLSRVVDWARKRGDHLLSGQSACTWVANTCQISPTAAADRLCVGEQLESMPRVAEALGSGEIGYQAASVICHLQKHVDELEVRIDEEMWIDNARRFSIKDLSDIAASTWHAVNPDGFCLDVEENFERRQLFISEIAGMYRVDGWLDPEAGAALKSAVEALAKPLGADDARTPRQRRAGALTEKTYHPPQAGAPPPRHGAPPPPQAHTTTPRPQGRRGGPALPPPAGPPA